MGNFRRSVRFGYCKAEHSGHGGVRRFSEDCLPEGTQGGAQFRLRNKGVPMLNGGGRGDLYIHIDVKVPSRLTREQRKLMEQLRETLPVDNAPAEKGIFEKVKDYFM